MAPVLYRSDKVRFHLPSLQQLVDGKQPNPIHVQLVISDLCNQDCDFCAYRTEGYSSNQLFGVQDPSGETNNNPNRMIPEPKVLEIIDDCASMGVQAIQLTGGGEPTVHPAFDRIAQRVKEKQLALALISNGVLLNDSRCEALKDIAWVRISVDAGSAEMYSKIRREGKTTFSRVATNVQQLARKSGRTATLGVGFVVTQQNYLEIADACRTFREWGVDNVRLSAVFQNDGDAYYQGLESAIREEIGLAKEALVRPGFEIYDNWSNRLQDLHDQNPEYSLCGHMNLVTYIGGDQSVYTCCMNAYNERGFIGSLKEQSFLQLWNSGKKQQMFQDFEPSGCLRCMYNDKNRVIMSYLDKKTVHDLFV